MRVAFEKGLVARLGDHGGIVLAVRFADIGVLEPGAVEELGIRRTRHQARDDEVGILELVAQPEAEVIDVALGAVVDELERAGDVPRDRTGHEDAAGVFRPHLLPDMVQQPGRAGDIGVDHMGDVRPLLIEERFAQPVAGIGEQDIGRAIAQRRHEGLEAIAGREIGFDRLDTCGTALPRGGFGRAKITVGGEDQVAAIAGRQLRELKTDAARSTGDHAQPGQPVDFPGHDQFSIPGFRMTLVHSFCCSLKFL